MNVMLADMGFNILLKSRNFTKVKSVPVPLSKTFFYAKVKGYKHIYNNIYTTYNNIYNNIYTIHIQYKHII